MQCRPDARPLHNHRFRPRLPRKVACSHDRRLERAVRGSCRLGRQPVRKTELRGAGVCRWFAAYQVWKVERERVVSLERQLADRATKEQILNALDNLIEQTKSFWRRRVTSDAELAEYAAQFDAFDASLRSMLSPLLSSAEIGALNAPTSSPLTLSHAFNTRHNQYLVRVETLLQRLSRLVERYS